MPGLGRAGLGVAAAVVVLALASGSGRAQLMIVGNDEKITFENGKPTPHEGGHDTLSIIDMSKPAALRMVATIPLDNTIVGPPTNLAITPSRDLALVANSVNGVPKDGSFTTVSDNRLFVIVEIGIMPARRFATAGFPEEDSIFAPCDRASRDFECIQPHAMTRTFPFIVMIGTHPEPAGGYENHVHIHLQIR